MQDIIKSNTNTLSYIQYIALFIVVVGFVYVDFTWQFIALSILSFYIFSILGLSLTLHRYYSHKNFEFKNNILRKLFTYIAILAGRGSPLGSTYRIHPGMLIQNDPMDQDFGLRFFDPIKDRKIK